jgi:hypothetical protein
MADERKPKSEKQAPQTLTPELNRETIQDLTELEVDAARGGLAQTDASSNLSCKPTGRA